MAETQKPPENTSSRTEVTPAGTSSSTPLGDRQFFAPQDLTAPAEAGYSTLSLLALVGFIVGATFAVVIVIMAKVALFSGKPMLMVGWTFVFPIAAIVLCVIARIRISQSEGTLAGRSLANWGLMSALLVGLCAWAYQTAVYFAVRQQSEAAIMEWFELVREGEIEKALLRTLSREIRSELREDDPNLASSISQRTSREQAGGYQNEIARFSQKPEIRAILQGGAETRFEPLGIKRWEYADGGYLVVWNFLLSTPELEAEVDATAHGVDSPNPEEGRIWTITRVAIAEGGRGIRQTPFGQRFSKRIKEGANFWLQWSQAFVRGEKLEAFLGTLPESRRQTARAEVARAAALGLAGGGGGVTGAPAADATTFAEFRRFVAGGLVTRDDKRFVGINIVREALLPLLREEFAKHPPSFQIGELHSPPMRLDAGGKFQLEFQTTLIILADRSVKPTPERPHADYPAEVLVVLEGDAQALTNESARVGWRIVSIKLIGGRQMTGQGNQPGL